MGAIRIKKEVFDNMGNAYNGAVVQFYFPIQPPQEYQQRMQQQNRGYEQSIDEIAARGVYEIAYRTFKSVEDLKDRSKWNRNFPLCKTADGVPVGRIVVEIPDSKNAFSYKLLKQKAVEYFAGIFGDKYVEMIEE